MFAVGVLAVAIGLVLTLTPAPLGTTARPTRGEATPRVLAMVFLIAAAALTLLTAITDDRSVATSSHGPASRSTPATTSPAAPTPSPGSAGQ